MSVTTSMDGRRVDRALTGFYAVVALVALAGQAGAAVRWLGWPLVFALGAVAAVEFGGIALSAYADYRRRLGEHALAARVLSAVVASGAVAVNWLGHADRLQGGFFAGMSALGYLVWLLHSGARRRDQLRAAGTLPPVAPAYGVATWVKHPGLTRRARALALADSSLGLYGSLAAAAQQMRTQTRETAIAKLLTRKLAEGRDPLAAQIAVTTYDLDEVARRLAAGADYDGLTALLSVELEPARVANQATRPLGDATTQPAESPALLPAQALPAPQSAREFAPVRPPVAPKKTAPARKRQPSAAERITKAAARTPEANAAQLAARLGLSERTVQRHMPKKAVDSVSTDTVPALTAA